MSTSATIAKVKNLNEIINSTDMEINLWSKFKVLLKMNGWSDIEIPHAVIEIKRFLILKVITNDYKRISLSPSMRVDSLWHLLLQFNREYTDMCLQLSPLLIFDRTVICAHIIGHNPLGQNDSEQNKRYTRTLQIYQEVFHQAAPDRFWSDVDVNDSDNNADNGNVRKRLRKNEVHNNELEEEVDIDENKDVHEGEEESSKESSIYDERFCRVELSKKTETNIYIGSKCSQSDIRGVMIKAFLKTTIIIL